MYLLETVGVFGGIEFEIVSSNIKLDGFTVVIVDAINKELRLYELEYIKSACTAKQFDDLLESIKIIWDLEYPDYNIKYWKTESNRFFLRWLGIELKDYC